MHRCAQISVQLPPGSQMEEEVMLKKLLAYVPHQSKGLNNVFLTLPGNLIDSWAMQEWLSHSGGS